MGMWEERWPIIGMVLLEFILATMTLLNKQALSGGLSSRILVFYRQSCATLFIFPIAYFSRRELSNGRMNMKLLVMVFITSFIGVTMFENLYVEGLHLTSSSVTTAMFNLVPAITFFIAAILGMEQVKVKRPSNIAKILGTASCVGGAIVITFLKGEKILNAQALLQGTHNWLLGCLLNFTGVSCLSSFLVLQVPITKRYSNYLFLSAWICLFSMLQTAIIALLMERDPKAWVLNSSIQIGACLFSGIFGTGAKYFIYSWCISRRGPLFVATFSPLSTVIATLLSTILFHEEVYSGSLLGSTVVVVGLYVFLWGKAREMKEKKEVEEAQPHIIATSSDNTSGFVDIRHPLLTDNSAV